MKTHPYSILLGCLMAATMWNSTPASSQNINTIAGNGTAGYAGDGGPATAAMLNSPFNVLADNAGNIYIADYGGHRLRKMSADGIITTIAGTGMGGSMGDGGPATAAYLFHPTDVDIDDAGNLYICDYANGRIRKINTAGIITTIAGTGFGGFSGDGGPSTAAQLMLPYGVKVLADGSVFITDQGNNRIRKISPSGIISTIAGTGVYANTGDGGPATAANLKNPTGIEIDPAGNLYVSSGNGYTVRKISPAGIITTIAGVGSIGTGGDGGPATAASLGPVFGLSADHAGNVYIADRGASKIRKISAAGMITTVAGTGALAYSGDGGPATAADLFATTGVYALPDGSKVYIADKENNRIRLVSCPLPPITGVAATACAGTAWTLTNASPGGKWTSSDTTIATVDSVTGALALLDHGSVTISYKDTTVCGLSEATTMIVINQAPDAGTITGPYGACPGDTVTLSDTVSGGAWSNKQPTVASVSATGIVAALVPGMDTILYVVSNSCGSDTATFVFATLYPESCPTTAVLHAAAAAGITVSPNPFCDRISIQITGGNVGKVQLNVYDLLGRIVAEQTALLASGIELGLAALPDGVYLLQVTTSTAEKRIRIVKEGRQ
jgi:hypothetical protein